MFLEEKLDEVFPDVTRQSLNIYPLCFGNWWYILHLQSLAHSILSLFVYIMTRMSPEDKDHFFFFFCISHFWYSNFHIADTQKILME